MIWLNIDEGKKQKKLFLKSNFVKKGNPQKCKENKKSSGGDWKNKF